MLDPLVAQAPQFTGTQFVVVAIVAIIGFFLLISFVLLAKYFNLWVQAKFSEAKVTLIELVGMSLRKVNPNIIVRSKIMAIQAGLTEKDGITTRSLEAHYLARRQRGRPTSVRALIAANRADIPLLVAKRAAAIDLAGRNCPRRGSRPRSIPKVIDRPDPTEGAPRRSTRIRQERHPAQGESPRHRPHEHRPPGRWSDRGDDHCPSRRGHRHDDRLGREPQHGPRKPRLDLQARAREGPRRRYGLRADPSSIDIADIDVGDNISANLQAAQAEADTRVARAKAEERRAFAVAMEQEFLAAVQENRAKVIQSEAEIPLAIAEAFRKGNLGVTDYYNLRNVQADTEMRNSIAGTGTNNARREPVNS